MKCIFEFSCKDRIVFKMHVDGIISEYDKRKTLISKKPIDGHNLIHITLVKLPLELLQHWFYIMSKGHQWVVVLRSWIPAASTEGLCVLMKKDLIGVLPCTSTGFDQDHKVFRNTRLCVDSARSLLYSLTYEVTTSQFNRAPLGWGQIRIRGVHPTSVQQHCDIII